MFGLTVISRPEVAALERVETLVRDRFGLAEAEIVLVAEERGRMPGLPERMTTILFWTADGARHRLRLFKPVVAVEGNDLPPSWLRAALRDEGEADCC